MSIEPRPWHARGPVLLGLVAIAVLIFGFGAWAVGTTIAGAVVVSGQIQVDENRQAIQHPDGGVVAEILVEEADTVEEGAVLLRLDPADIRPELTIAQSQLVEWRARRARLEAERDGADTIPFADDLLALADADPEVAEVLDGQRNLFATRADTLQGEIDQLQRRAEQIEAQLEGVRSQQDALERQGELLASELVDTRSLNERGLVPDARLFQLEQQEAQLAGTIGELAAAAAESAGRLTEIELSILQRYTQRREEAIAELREVRIQEAELAERVRTLQARLERLDLRAPVDGVVYDLQVFGARSVVRPADPVLYLVPQDRPLVIAVRIDPTDIDQVYPGQPVTLRFPAFDARTTPELIGELVQVSADAFTDDATGQSYYRGEMVLAEGQVELLEDRVLLPGMPVEGFIRTTDRRPLDYLLQPLTDYLARAFRES